MAVLRGTLSGGGGEGVEGGQPVTAAPFLLIVPLGQDRLSLPPRGPAGFVSGARQAAFSAPAAARAGAVGDSSSCSRQRFRAGRQGPCSFHVRVP